MRPSTSRRRLESITFTPYRALIESAARDCQEVRLDPPGGLAAQRVHSGAQRPRVLLERDQNRFADIPCLLMRMPNPGGCEGIQTRSWVLE